MNVRELIEKLNDLPESFKDLPVAVDCGLKDRSTKNPDVVYMGWDECHIQSIILEWYVKTIIILIKVTYCNSYWHQLKNEYNFRVNIFLENSCIFCSCSFFLFFLKGRFLCY